MALPDYSTLEKGTAVTWANTGGTKVLNGKALTNTSIRQGDKSASLIETTGSARGMPEFIEWTFETKVQSAPTAGNEFILYLGCSSSATAGTDNPAGLTGADGTGPNADVLPDLDLVGALIMSNNLGTGLQRRSGMKFYPYKEYVIPVIQNSTGQTTSNVDGETIVTMTPWYRKIQD